MCCSSWGHKESDMTEGLNRTELNFVILGKLLNLLILSFFFNSNYISIVI